MKICLLILVFALLTVSGYAQESVMHSVGQLSTPEMSDTRYSPPDSGEPKQTMTGEPNQAEAASTPYSPGQTHDPRNLISGLTSSVTSDLTQEPSFALNENVTEAMRKEAGTVKESLEKTASQFFTPEPLGFTFSTFTALYLDVLKLPLKLPRLINYIIDQARLLGFIGSLVIFLFLSGLTYMLTGQRKVLNYLESIILPMIASVPKAVHPYLELVLKLAAAAMFPGIFWVIFWFVQSFTGLEQPWFLLIGRLMVVWAAGVAGLVALKELFIGRLIPIPETYGKTMYRVTRLMALYIIFTVIIFYCAEAFRINPEYLALLKVVLYLTVVLASLGLLVKKQAILSLLPELPYRGYRIFRSTLTRVYGPAMIGTFLTGVLWSFGYHTLCRYIWTKTWAVAVVIVVIMLAYHFSSRMIGYYRQKYPKENESAESYFRSLMAGLVFITAVLLFYSVFSLLGIFAPMKRLISFPIFYAGASPVSLWTGIRAFLVIYIFYQMAQIIRGYLDMKVFPILGVEEGLAYSINTFIGYVLIIVGTLFAMHTTGLDLRILMVFAGAIGIGVGLGLQGLAANVIAGFALIFGRRIRKGDWIETGETMGYVREVSLRATKVVTRDNIEFIIPNSELTSKTIVNYTLTEPLVRIHIPVGVSYRASPDIVRSLLLQVAGSYKNIDHHRKPDVMFTEYADSSINFALLVWIDVRKISELEVKSDLYYRIFSKLAENGIEIPFPQRDIHIRSESVQK